MDSAPRCICHIGQNHGASRTEIGILVALFDSAIHLEIVGDRQLTSGSREFEKSVAVIALAGKASVVEGSVERAISIKKINIARAVGSQPGSRHPDGAIVAVGSYVQYTRLFQRSFVVTDNPTGIG